MTLQINERMDKFARIIRESFPEGKQPTILITQMDPDAEGAAIGLQYYLERVLHTADVQIFFAGSIDHPQNKAIFNFFNLGEVMFPIENNADLGNVILVDSSMSKDSRFLGKFTPVAIFDHHEGGDVKETEKNFVWIEPVGATCTLIGEMIQSAQELNATEREFRAVATLCALGIATDVKGFKEPVDRKRDRSAWNFFMDNASPEHYGRLAGYDLPAEYFDYMNELTSKTNCILIKEAFLVSHVGLMNPDEAAFLSMFADMLLRRMGVKTVIVWAPIKGVGFAVKIRSNDTSVNLVERLRQLFNSGGAKSKEGVGAGGTIVHVDPLLMPSEENAGEAILFFDKSLRQKIQDVL